MKSKSYKTEYVSTLVDEITNQHTICGVDISYTNRGVMKVQ